MTKRRTSTSSETTTPEATTTTEAETTTEANAAAAGLEDFASPTHRRLEDHSTLPLPPLSHREPVIGTESLVKKVLGAKLIAHSLRATKQNNNSRETPTGAGVSERGDPLLIIRYKK